MNKEIRPYQVSSQPIFLIAFTALAIIYGGWMVYAYFIQDAPISWYSIIFMGAVLIFLWYNRINNSFFVKVSEDRVEWLLKRNKPVIVRSSDVEMVSEHRMSVDFLVDSDWHELPLQDFEKSGKRGEVLSAIEAWCDQHKIEFKEAE